MKKKNPKRPIRIGWQYLPRKKKKKAKKLLEKVINTDYFKKCVEMETNDFSKKNYKHKGVMQVKP